MIGTIHIPKEIEGQGPLHPDMLGMAEGCIRVMKTCQECRTRFEGWEFIANIRRSGDHYPGALDIGLVKACDDCINKWEDRRAITDLERSLERAKRNWEDIRENKKKLPAAREMRRCLEKLTSLILFTKPLYEKHATQLDKISTWITQHEETL